MSWAGSSSSRTTCRQRRDKEVGSKEKDVGRGGQGSSAVVLHKGWEWPTTPCRRPRARRLGRGDGGDESQSAQKQQNNTRARQPRDARQRMVCLQDMLLYMYTMV